MSEFTHEDFLRNLKAYIKYEDLKKVPKICESKDDEAPEEKERKRRLSLLARSLDENNRNSEEEPPEDISLKEVHKEINKRLLDDVERATLPRDYESDDKMVSHPSHYQSKNGIEVIDVIESFTEDLEGIEAVCAGNAIKYLCRWSKKNGVQDLEKSIWYIRKLINVLQTKNKERYFYGTERQRS